MLLLWTKRTDVSRGVVDKSVPNHLVLAFKPLATDTPGTAFNWTEVGSILRMDICMRAADYMSQWP